VRETEQGDRSNTTQEKKKKNKNSIDNKKKKTRTLRVSFLLPPISR